MREVQTDEHPRKTRSNKSKKAGAPDPYAVMRFSWTLHDLPSSQHRAGLAGLALAVAFLRRKGERNGVCGVNCTEDRLTLSVDRKGMQSLFDDVYGATLEETRSKSKWPGAEPKYVVEVEVKDEKTGKVKNAKRFAYDRVVPSGPMIGHWDGAAAGAPTIWLKLWQDMVWSTLRGVPATREPFNARAHGRTTDDGGKAWDELATEPDGTVELPSTYALGVQAKNAENVAFTDVVRMRFLLHFWPAVAAIYVPAVLQRDGRREFVGYALAIPDVAVLTGFTAAWEQVVRRRGRETAGYVPREAVIDLVAEAGLDVVRRSNELIPTMQGASSMRLWLSGVDVFHVEKDGNNVRLRGVARVTPQRKQDDEYRRVRSANYWSAIFRRRRIGNVLDGKPWWSGFARLCSTTSDEITIRHQSFQHDCRLAFTEVEVKQDVPETEQTLEQLIFRRVRAYVLGKTERKYNTSWQEVQANSANEKEYRDKKEKVAREAFLAVRSRTGADFVTYFTSTLCSVPEQASEDKYLQIARALMDSKSVEQVRSLTLLALSAVA